MATLGALKTKAETDMVLWRFWDHLEKVKSEYGQVQSILGYQHIILEYDCTCVLPQTGLARLCGIPPERYKDTEDKPVLLEASCQLEGDREIRIAVPYKYPDVSIFMLRCMEHVAHQKGLLLRPNRDISVDVKYVSKAEHAKNPLPV